MCEQEEQLGRHRRRWKDKDGETFVEITQPDYCEEVYQKFKEHCPTRTIHTPFLESVFISRSDESGQLWPENAEKSKEILDRGGGGVGNTAVGLISAVTNGAKT